MIQSLDPGSWKKYGLILLAILVRMDLMFWLKMQPNGKVDNNFKAIHLFFIYNPNISI